MTTPHQLFLPALCLLLGTFLSPLVATGDSLYFLLPSDTVILQADPVSKQLYFKHVLAPRQTLYGAARFYGLRLDDVYRLNPHLRQGYQPGSTVTVAIPAPVLRPSFTQDSVAWFVPVHYRFEKGETVFNLSRRILGHPGDSILQSLNPGQRFEDLQPGQLLKIGYLRIDGIDPERQLEVQDHYVLLNRSVREAWYATTDSLKLRRTNGKAAWTDRGDRNKWMVLHRTAPINSLIEIEDPRSRKIIYAKVVGRIPERVYDRRVVLVVSPLLVKAFGVRDQEFYVRTRHL
jgi:LysM repeat protein